MGRIKGVWDRCVVLNNTICGCCSLINHKATANRVVNSFLYKVFIGIKGRKLHSIRVVGKCFFSMQYEVVLLAVFNRVLSSQHDFSIGENILHPAIDRPDINRFRKLSFQTHHYCARCTMTLTCCTQRAIHFSFHSNNGAKFCAIAKSFNKAMGRTHGPHGVRARWAYTNLK